MFTTMKTSPVLVALGQFFKTNTLHGFKYLLSPFPIDRVCWLGSCAASAGCAGALCLALWARFVQAPVLLALQDVSAVPPPAPVLAVCLPHDRTARLFLESLTNDTRSVNNLLETFAMILKRNPAPDGKLMELEALFELHNVTLPDDLLATSAACGDFVKRCRRQTTELPCEDMFQVKMTPKGVCCVAQSPIFEISEIDEISNFLFDVSLALDCTDGSVLYGCYFFSTYDVESWIRRVFLQPGYTHTIFLSYSLVQDAPGDEIVMDACVPRNHYSKRRCLKASDPEWVHFILEFPRNSEFTNTCIESTCGCIDPFGTVVSILDDKRTMPLPICSMTSLNCLRTTYTLENITCGCLPPCKEMSSEFILESNRIVAIEHTFDPIYENLNATRSMVLHIIARTLDSKVYSRNPTETWLTLLSSLGGVFNMFLGFGLFSALEFLFLLFVKIPIVLLKST